MEELSEYNAIVNQLRELVNYLEMKELINQHWELAYNSGFQAGRASQRKIQQQFSKKSPYQHDSYSPYHPNFHSQTQPYLHPSFHNSFQPPHYNNPPYSTENAPDFFNPSEFVPNFPAPSYDDSHFQNQEQPFYPQPHAQTEHSYYSQPYEHREFQQENQFFDFHEPQLSQMPAAALTQGVERQSEVAADSYIPSHGAGTPWSYQHEGVESKQKEEENAFTWVNEAETRAGELNQAAMRWENGANEKQFSEHEESGYVGADLDLNAPGLLQQEEEKEGQDNELKEEEEKVEEADDSSYPLFRIGDQLFASSTCQGFLSLQPVKDQHVEGGVEQSKEELDIPSPSAQNRKLQQEREKEEEKGRRMEEDFNGYPMFKIGDRILTYDQFEEESKGKNQVEEERRIAAAMKYYDEQEIPFPAALNKTQQQKEEEAGKRKLEEEQKLLPLLPIRKKEGEKENKLEEDEYFSLLFKEEEAYACGVHLKKRRKKRRKKKKKKLEGVQHTLLTVKEVDTIEEVIISDLDFLIQEVQTLFQHGFSFKGEGEKEESLQISPYSPHLHNLKDKDFTSLDSHYLLQEVYSITAGQSNEEQQQLEGEEANAITTGQHLFKEEKKQEEEQKVAITPDLQEDEVSELHLPQATTPRQKEAAVYPSMFNNFAFEFELTSNEFSLSLSMFISGAKLQTQQLLLNHFCKLHLNALLGDVHKKGTKGEGVPWFIKVHPP